jgi:hypothetical protein
MRDWELARRDLLRGLGLGLGCLPLLVARPARGAPAPARLVLIEVPQGYRQAYWRPAAGTLANQTIPDSLTPLEAHLQDLLVLSNLANSAVGPHVGHGSFATLFHGLPAVGEGTYKEPNGPTLDQVVARTLPIPAGGRSSLTLGVQVDRPPQTLPAPGATRCFWADAGKPLDPAGDPSGVYAELFTGMPADNAAPARRLLARRKSILDYVGSNLEDWKGRAGTDQRPVIEQHLQSLRDLEIQLQADGPIDTCRPGEPLAIDLTDFANYARILDAQLRLTVAALKCGVTNVVALQLSDATGRNVNLGAFVPGVPLRSQTDFRTPYRNWHDLGHSPVSGGVDHKRIVDKWVMQQVANLLTMLKKIPEGNGSFLDNTIVLVGNPIQEGASHDTQKMPWLLAGNRDRYFAGGECLASEGQPSKGVLAAVCEALGVTHRYGDVNPGLRRI